MTNLREETGFLRPGLTVKLSAYSRISGCDSHKPECGRESAGKY